MLLRQLFYAIKNQIKDLDVIGALMTLRHSERKTMSLVGSLGVQTELAWQHHDPGPLQTAMLHSGEE